MSYNNVERLLRECKNPETYNFEFECDYEDYKAMGPLERFLVYKSTFVGEEIAEAIRKGKDDEAYHKAALFSLDNYRRYPDLTDCDGWDGKCELAVDLYQTLWNWKPYSEKKYDSQYGKIEGLGSFGGDTFNSVQTTLNEYLGDILEDNEGYQEHMQGYPSIRLCLQLYCIYGKDFMAQFEKKEEFMRFIELCHTFGNLVLVPSGYNGYRGCKSYIRDYADLSLFNLLHNCDGNSGRFLGEDEETRKRNGVRYINFSFLWDYVEKTKDNTYEVLPLCDSHKLKMQTWDVMGIWDKKNVLPRTEELEDLSQNISNRIIRRGRFMTAMLEISIKNPDVYTRLMQEVFMTERVYEGYGEVIEAIREKLRPSEADVYEAITAILIKPF